MEQQKLTPPEGMTDWLRITSHRSKLSLGQATGQTKGKVKYLLEKRKYSFIKLELISLKIKFAAGLSASAALGALLHTLLEILLCRKVTQSPAPASVVSCLFS